MFCSDIRKKIENLKLHHFFLSEIGVFGDFSGKKFTVSGALRRQGVGDFLGGLVLDFCLIGLGGNRLAATRGDPPLLGSRAQALGSPEGNPPERGGVGAGTAA